MLYTTYSVQYRILLHKYSICVCPCTRIYFSVFFFLVLARPDLWHDAPIDQTSCSETPAEDPGQVWTSRNIWRWPVPVVIMECCGDGLLPGVLGVGGYPSAQPQYGSIERTSTRASGSGTIGNILSPSLSILQPLGDKWVARTEDALATPPDLTDTPTGEKGQPPIPTWSTHPLGRKGSNTLPDFYTPRGKGRKSRAHNVRTEKQSGRTSEIKDEIKKQ